MEVGVEKESSYGPISDGVTGSEGGGGRLISVGVVILMDVIRCLEMDGGVRVNEGKGE